MRQFYLLIVTIVGISSAAFASEEFPYLKVGLNHYTNVVITSVTATDIFFTHSRGMGNARLSTLAPELQKQFGYDPAKAAAATQRAAPAKPTPAPPPRPKPRPPNPPPPRRKLSRRTFPCPASAPPRSSAKRRPHWS
jgi:hypothetical protein